MERRDVEMNLFELTGKIVFITGGTRGIGLSIAMAMKEAGAKVWIHGSKEESTAKIANMDFHTSMVI